MAVPSLTRAVTERGQSHLSFDRLSTYAIISKHPLADLHKHGGLCTHYKLFFFFFFPHRVQTRARSHNRKSARPFGGPAQFSHGGCPYADGDCARPKGDDVRACSICFLFPGHQETKVNLAAFRFVAEPDESPVKFVEQSYLLANLVAVSNKLSKTFFADIWAASAATRWRDTFDRIYLFIRRLGCLFLLVGCIPMPKLKSAQSKSYSTERNGADPFTGLYALELDGSL